VVALRIIMPPVMAKASTERDGSDRLLAAAGRTFLNTAACDISWGVFEAPPHQRASSRRCRSGAEATFGIFNPKVPVSIPTLPFFSNERTSW
jgi:hypothetical protein